MRMVYATKAGAGTGARGLLDRLSKRPIAVLTISTPVTHERVSSLSVVVTALAPGRPTMFRSPPPARAHLLEPSVPGPFEVLPTGRWDISPIPPPACATWLASSR